MSTNVGAVDFEMLLNSNPFNQGLKNANNAIKNSGIENSLKRIGKLALGAFSVKAIVDFTKSCLDLGSDLSEVQNVVDVTFGNLNSEVDKFAQNAITQFGLGQTVTKKYVGTFGAMAKAFDFSNEAALEMSETLTGLVGDVASFYNLSSDVAYTKLKSVFTGETETLKDLGIVMTQTALDEYALANGFGKTTSKMKEQEKTALRYQFVLDKLSIAQGDFARTSDGWANQTRVLSLRFDELKASLGQGFINLFTPIVKGINWVLARLQVLADAFKSFTEFITGKKADSSNGLGGVSSDIAGITSSAEEAKTAVSGIGDSAKKSAKELNNLAGFDNLNVLQKNDDSSSGSGAGAGISEGLDFGNSLQEAVEQASSGMDIFISKAKELMDIFKSGFKTSFENTSFDGILQHLNNIKNSIINIFTDGEVINSAQNLINTFVYSLGQTTGAIARIGTNIVENLVGSIDKYLSQNSGRIKNFFITMFDISSKDTALTGNLWQAFGEISDIFSSDTAKQIGANIIAMFANPLMSAIELIGKFALDLRAIFVQPIIDNTDKIKTTFEGLLTPIQKITGTISEAFTFIGGKLNSTYDKHIKPLMDSLKTGLSDTFGKLLDVYNENIAPFVDNAANKFKELWETHLKPLVDKVGELIGSIADAITALWENILKPVIDWIVENIVPVLAPIFESLWNTISNVFGAIADMLGGIIDMFRGLIDFIVGIFTGDWEKAWEGIKTFFIGIWDTIKGFFSAIWEFLKGIVETAINAIKAVITTVFNAIKTFFQNIWNGICELFKNIWNTIVAEVTKNINNMREIITNVVNAIKETWDKIWNGIKTTLSNIWNTIKSTVSNAINNTKNTISSALNGIKSIWDNVWNSLKTTVTNIFTSIWNFIKNIINSILGGVEKMANGVINALNGMINALNKIHFDIPDWVPGLGGKSFGINIPNIKNVSIPRLAEGGFVKANTPQLAMIGDNKNQGEIVAPENKIIENVLEALKLFFKEQANTQNNNNQANEIVLKFEGTLSQLIRVLKPKLDEEAKRKGNKLIIGGNT